MMENLENLLKSLLSKSPEPSKWNGNGNLSSRIANLQKTGFLSDLTLYVGQDKEEFKVHRFILQISSSVFHQLFKNHPQLDKMEFSNVESSTFKVFLKYLYSCSGSNIINIDNAQPMLTLASKFQVDDLSQICTNILTEQLTNKNACKLFQLGMDYVIKDLMESSLSYIAKNAWEIIEEKDFEELTFDCIFEILQKDDLQVSSEIQLFNGIVRWGEAECKRKQLEPYSPISFEETKLRNEIKKLVPLLSSEETNLRNEIKKLIPLITSEETNLRNKIKKLIPLIRFPTMDEKEFIITVMTKEILSYEDAFGIISCMQQIQMDKRVCLSGIRGTGKYNSKPRQYYKPPIVHHVNGLTKDIQKAPTSTEFDTLNVVPASPQNRTPITVPSLIRSLFEVKMPDNFLLINQLDQGVQTPRFENFKTIGKFEISKEKVYSGDEGPPNIPRLVASSEIARFQRYSLTVGYKKAVRIDDYEEYNKLKMQCMLNWLIKTQYFKKFQEKMHKKPDFICFGNQITDTMITPLQTRRRDWEIYASQYNDTVFIWRKARPETCTNDEISYFGFANQALLTGKNLATQKFNQYEKCFVTQEVTFGPHQLLLFNDIDAQDDEGNWVDIKTYKECNPFGMKGKYLGYWGKSVVSGVNKLVLGRRDDKGILHETNVLSVEEALTRVGWTNSDMDQCYQFENHFLTWVKSHFNENNPKLVKKFSWSGPQQSDQVECVKVDEKDLPIGGMFPDWFIQQVP